MSDPQRLNKKNSLKFVSKPELEEKILPTLCLSLTSWPSLEEVNVVTKFP